MSKTRLLNKTTRSFLLYAVIILLASAPVFYYICQWLYVYETDEVLLFHKGAFERNKNSLTQADIASWNKYNRNVTILPDTGITKDSIYGITELDPVSKEMEPFRVLCGPVTISGQRYTYVEKNNLVVMEGMVVSIAAMFLVIIMILLVGIIYISRASATKIWRPFYDTLRKIQDFEIDKNRRPRFTPTDIDEFDSLNKSIEKLIEKNTAIYQSQREFVENAAHELQTPLALFQTKIDTLAQYEGLSQEQSELTAAFRVYNNRHWVTDVVAGAGIGILSTKIAYWINPFITHTLFGGKEQERQTSFIMPFYDGKNVGVGFVKTF